MRAMLLRQSKPIDERPLELAELQRPHPAAGQILIEVHACGVCHTDLHIVEGELPPHKSPVVPGHQIVGRVVELGEGVTEHAVGRPRRRALAALDRRHLQVLPARRREPLRGREVHGLGRRRRLRRVHGGAGGLQLCAARGPVRPRRRAAALRRHHRLSLTATVGTRPVGTRQTEAARAAPPEPARPPAAASASTASAPPPTSACRSRATGAPRSTCSRAATKHKQLARELGAVWAGDAGEAPGGDPSIKLDAAIIFAPAGELVIDALKVLDKGGIVADGRHLLVADPADRVSADLRRACACAA